jgi:hypothetical protein
MQLDIFEHSRDVVLRNAVVEALRRRDNAAAARELALERQGRHDELIAGRAKLRAAHPALFARYMRDR